MRNSVLCLLGMLVTLSFSAKADSDLVVTNIVQRNHEVRMSDGSFRDVVSTTFTFSVSHCRRPSPHAFNVQMGESRSTGGLTVEILSPVAGDCRGPLQSYEHVKSVFNIPMGHDFILVNPSVKALQASQIPTYCTAVACPPQSFKGPDCSCHHESMIE